MPMPAPNELLAFLGRSQLLNPTQIDILEREGSRFASADQLTANLVARGWLTTFQEKYLLEDQGEKLVVGPFRLLEVIGEGGMGMVYKAVQLRLDRFIALKVIRPQVLAAKPEIVSRFHREAKAIAHLSHPNIVIIFDAGEIDGTHYLAMEYVEGITLEKMVRLNGPLEVRRACDYMRQAALGLQHAYEWNLVHRDIKPSNLLVSQRSPGGGTGRSSVALKRPALVTPRDKQLAAITGVKGPHPWGMLKILDMGLARLQEQIEEAGGPVQTPLTRAGALLGTPDFISPEQARDPSRVTIHSDLYSLGCTFFYVLTQRPPFSGGTELQKLVRHQTEAPTPALDELRPHLPTGVVTIVERLMQKQKEDRYQTPQELADALSAFLNTPSDERATPPTPLRVAEQVPATPQYDDLEPPVLGTGTPLTAQAISETPSAFDTLMVEVGGPPSETQNRLLTKAHAGLVGAVAVSSDGRLVASGGVDGKVRLWDCTGPQLREVEMLPRPNAEIQTLCFAPDEPYLMVAGIANGRAPVWRWEWKESRVFEGWGDWKFSGVGAFGASAFSSDGKAFAAAFNNQVVHWKVASRTPAARSIIKGHSRPIQALAFSPDRRLLASAGEGRSIRIWGFGWLGASLRARVEGHSDNVTSMAFSPDGKILASASLDKAVMLWDAANPGAQDPRVLYGHTGGVRLVQFLPDARRLVSVADGGQVFFWDVKTGVKLTEFHVTLGIPGSLSVTPDGRRVVVGTSDGRLACFELEPASRAGATMGG